MTLQLKVMIKCFFYFKEADIMLPSSKNSDVGIGASSWENKLFWTDNAKYSVEYDFNVSQQFFVEHSWHSQMQ